MRKAIVCLVIGLAMPMLALPASASTVCTIRAAGVEVGGHVAAFRVESTPGSSLANGPVVLVSQGGGEVFVGQAETLLCSINGASVADVTGSGTWNGEPVTFDLAAFDDDDESTDFYVLRIFSDGVQVFEIAGIPTRGDIIVHEVF